MKLLMYFNLTSIQSGLFISNLSTIFGLFYFYKLLLEDYKVELSEKIIFTLLIFPTAFYFTALYNESLFFLLSVASFYYARRSNFLAAFILAGLSAVTRSIGLVVIFSIFLEYFLKVHQPINFKQFIKDKYFAILLISISFKLIIEIINSWLFPSTNPLILFLYVLNSTLDYLLIILTAIILSYKLFKNLDYKKVLTMPTLYLSFSFLPLLLFILYQYLSFNNPLGFIDLQKYWGRSLTFPWYPIKGYLSFLSFNQYIKVSLTNQVTLELVIALIAIIAFIRSIFTLRISYMAYFGLALLVPMTSGTFTSIHRYILIAFPLFIVLATLKNRYLYLIWVYFSILFSAVLSIMFINNYWVT